MKRLIFPLLLIAVAAGCTLTGDDDKPAAVISAETYLPLKAAASWTYAYKDSTGELSDPYSVLVTGEATNEGKTGWMVTNTYVDSVSHTMFVCIDGDACSEFSDKVYKPVMRQKTATGFFTEQVLYKFSVAPGTTWTAYTYPTGTGTQTVTGEYCGLETVTVPAGTFENCAKFELSGTGTTETRWLAPNVGLVEIQYSETRSCVLTQYTPGE